MWLYLVCAVHSGRERQRMRIEANWIDPYLWLMSCRIHISYSLSLWQTGRNVREPENHISCIDIERNGTLTYWLRLRKTWWNWMCLNDKYCSWIPCSVVSHQFNNVIEVIGVVNCNFTGCHMRPCNAEFFVCVCVCSLGSVYVLFSMFFSLCCCSRNALLWPERRL